MIAPHMATMLCFVVTDAAVEGNDLQRLWSEVTVATFNRTTVDSDTSTNDCAILMASGAAGNERVRASQPSEYARFRELVLAAVHPLAKLMAADGEGATKLVKVEAEGFGSDEACSRVARTIAESPLVKTAMFGCDPNWGRIIAAAGRSGVAFQPESVSIELSHVPVFVGGCPQDFDRDALVERLRSHEAYIRVRGGQAEGADYCYTCDYSYDYIKINAEYHT